MFLNHFSSELDKAAMDESSKDLAIGAVGAGGGAYLGHQYTKSMMKPDILKQVRGEYKEKLQNVVSHLSESGKLPKASLGARFEYFLRGAKALK